MAEQERRWYEDVMSWGQVNIIENEPALFDVDWWERYFLECKVDGIVVNAGGFMAYYPTELQLQTPSQFLGDRDLFGEMVDVAKTNGLRILARIDPNKAAPRVYYEHPEWFAIDEKGEPDFVDGYYTTCPNGPYYYDFVPQIFQEVIQKYDVDGFLGNHWFGRPRGFICRCSHCKAKFKRSFGLELPRKSDWQDESWLKYIQFYYQSMTDVTMHFRSCIRSYKSEAIWVGVGLDLLRTSNHGIDIKKIASLSDIMQVETQGRWGDIAPLWWSGEQGKVMAAAGPEKARFNLFGTYSAGAPSWRWHAKQPEEQRIWMAEIVASATRPWFHTVGGVNEDRRGFKVVRDFFRDYKRHQKHYRTLRSIANVALVFSQRTLDYYGKANAYNDVIKPFRGMYYALMRQRIPFDVILEEDIVDQKALAQYKVLVLPNIACLSAQGSRTINVFVEQGGGVVASGATSLYDEYGEARQDFALASALGVQYSSREIERLPHSYLRLVEKQHPIFSDFAHTDIIPNEGGMMIVEPVTASVLASLVPPSPIYPPELSWTSTPVTARGVVFANAKGSGKAVYLANHLDALVLEYNLVDHVNLITSCVNWVMNKNSLPVKVKGCGLLDVYIYEQPDLHEIQVHLVNLNHANAWRPQLDQLTPLPAQELEILLPHAEDPINVHLLWQGKQAEAERTGNILKVRIEEIVDYEVLVISLRR